MPRVRLHFIMTNLLVSMTVTHRDFVCTAHRVTVCQCDSVCSAHRLTVTLCTLHTESR